MPVAATKCLISVHVGLASEMLIPERCRSWCYTSDDYAKDNSPDAEEFRFRRMIDEASDYAHSQMNPTANNFVRLEWVWV